MTKVSLRDLATTVNEFEGTVRSHPGGGSGDVLAAIDTIRQALNDISSKSDTSDQIFCVSDQIICGDKNNA
jgi:RNase adaptor protein for sRNA GlmZ degradation